MSQKRIAEVLVETLIAAGVKRVYGVVGDSLNAILESIGKHKGIEWKLEYPGRQVVTLSGDGGLAMLMGDLLTLRQSNLPVKMVVFNNSALSFVELEMKAAGVLENGTTLVNPNFADLANSAGIHGIRVEDPAELKPAMEEAFCHDGPALIDVVVNRMELSMPPTINREQAAGFSVWALKAVLNGRGSELVDLAKSNLLR